MNPQPNKGELDRLQLIERYAETFGLDLSHQVEAAAASQEADYVLDLIAHARQQARESLAAELKAADDKVWREDNCGHEAIIEQLLAHHPEEG